MFNWSSAFAGSISSYLSVGTELFGDGAAAIGGRTLIMAMVGGTTSVITGGKFEDGTVSATFVHLFNYEGIGMGSVMTFERDVSKKMRDTYVDAGTEIATEATENSGLLLGVAGLFSSGGTSWFFLGVGMANDIYNQDGTSVGVDALTTPYTKTTGSIGSILYNLFK